VSGPDGEGDDVLNDAKSWESYTHTFDPDARLATYENIGEEAKFALKGDDSELERALVRRRQLQLAVLLVILVVMLSLVLTHLPTR